MVCIILYSIYSNKLNILYVKYIKNCKNYVGITFYKLNKLFINLNM